jgi:hypothetical protein
MPETMVRKMMGGDKDLDDGYEVNAQLFHPDGSSGSKLPQQHGGYQGNEYEQGQVAGEPGIK